MRILNKIASSGSQQLFLTGNPGQRITMNLRYLPSQKLWSMDVQYLDFILQGILVMASPNMLQNYKNIIPFGIACSTVNGLDPYYIDDFTAQRASLFLLSAADVSAIEEAYFGG